MNHIPRGMILRPEWVDEHSSKCEKCNNDAYATDVDEGWDEHYFCAEHYPKHEFNLRESEEK